MRSWGPNRMFGFPSAIGSTVLLDVLQAFLTIIEVIFCVQA